MWLKQTGLGIAGLSVGQLKPFASPIPEYLLSEPGDNPIFLDLNENPYGPSPLAKIAMRQNLNISNRYNWKLSLKLVSSISDKINLDSSNILMGAGATEILNLVLRYTALQKGSFILSDPTYDSWTRSVQLLGCSKIAIPLTKDKCHDLDAIIKAIKPDTGLIYICNPNNPTGTICERSNLVSLLNKIPESVILLVDEAYLDYSNQQSLSDLVPGNKNLIVVKTFSKIYGFAGGRIGYAIANTDVVSELWQLQSWPPESISVVSVIGATAALKDKKFVDESNYLNEKVKKYTTEKLESLNIKCIPSQTNFIYFSLSDYNKDYFKQLENNNIIGTGIYEKQGQWTRITIGTSREMETFIAALQ